jgi:hypothetical protein
LVGCRAGSAAVQGRLQSRKVGAAFRPCRCRPGDKNMQVDSISSSSRWPRRIHEYRVQRVASRQRGQLIDAGIVEFDRRRSTVPRCQRSYPFESLIDLAVGLQYLNRSADRAPPPWTTSMFLRLAGCDLNPCNPNCRCGRDDRSWRSELVLVAYERPGVN